MVVKWGVLSFSILATHIPSFLVLIPERFKCLLFFSREWKIFPQGPFLYSMICDSFSSWPAHLWNNPWPSSLPCSSIRSLSIQSLHLKNQILQVSTLHSSFLKFPEAATNCLRTVEWHFPVDSYVLIESFYIHAAQSGAPHHVWLSNNMGFMQLRNWFFFLLYLILIDLNSNRHTQLGAPQLDSAEQSMTSDHFITNVLQTILWAAFDLAA